MTTICDRIPFKLVQKILAGLGNYEPIMGICGKLWIINFHNLQMLSMLRIKYKFSECLAQGSPTWCPRAPGQPEGPSRSPAGLF